MPVILFPLAVAFVCVAVSLHSARFICKYILDIGLHLTGLTEVVYPNISFTYYTSRHVPFDHF